MRVIGTGTGHCGTRSLAAQLDIPHEPHRGNYQPHRQFAFDDPPPMDVITKHCSGVDSFYAPYLDTILRVHQGIRVVWVWRTFDKVRISHARPGIREYRHNIKPRSGWPDSLDDHTWWYWTATNIGIYKAVIQWPRSRWYIVEAESLGVRVGVSPPPEEDYGYDGRGEHLDQFFRSLAEGQEELDEWLRGE